ncbi:MAG: hypothetical protein [Caudoviricetes sp.]|nr:MAG: hypothetical protein [Caudoviricetes sp.]
MAVITDEMERVAKRFEEAVSSLSYHETIIMIYGESSGSEEAKRNYEEAKARLYECLSWVP